MRLFLAVMAIAALSVSCASRTRTAAAPAIKLPPPQPAMARQVQNAIDAGDGDYQVRWLRQRMAGQPDDLEARLSLARRYEDLGSPELALEHYRLAAARFPDSPQVHLLLARSLRRAGARAEAASMLEAFLAAHPQASPEFSSWLGIVLDEQQRWAEGERAHRAALALAPKSDYLHNNLGYNLLMQGKPDAAAAEFREALKFDPHSPLARNNLAMALANKPDQAEIKWQSVGDPAAAHNNMAALLIDQGRYAEARKELDLALGYNRNYSAALNNLRLVSELDGKPAFIQAKPVQTRWARMKAGLRKAFVYDNQDQSKSIEANTPENRRGL
jgi:Flp pilus assembly protein TadD